MRFKMTENKQKEREDAIIKMCRSYGLKQKGHYIISFWDLVYNLNNCWYAPLFMSISSKDDVRINLWSDTEWSIKHYKLFCFRRMINWTIKRMDDVKIIQDHPVWYKIKERGKN